MDPYVMPKDNVISERKQTTILHFVMSIHTGKSARYVKNPLVTRRKKPFKLEKSQFIFKKRL